MPPPGLFSFDDIQVPNAKPERIDHRNRAWKPKTFISIHEAKVADLVSAVEPEVAITYMTRAAWSSHQLIAGLLEKTGPADLYMTSYAITEQPLRELIRLQSEGMIGQMTGLFDHRVKIHNPDAWQLATGTFHSLGLARNHSKVIVLVGTQLSLVVNGSANMTRNPRIETGDILVSREMAAAHTLWINEEIDEYRRNPHNQR